MSIKTAFHSHIWRRLPHGLRREALFRVAGMIAPRPALDAPGLGPIFVAGALRTASGLGEAARLSYQALRRSGFDVCGVDLTAALMQREDKPDFAFSDGAGHEGPGVVLLHVNGPVTPLAMLRLGRRFVTGKRIVGWWAWELPRVPDDWRHGLPFVHEVWTLSDFTADALAQLDGRRPPTLPPPCAMDVVAAPHPLRAPDDPFRALTIFNVASSFARKNPFAAIRAFRAAFGDDPSVRLTLKLANPTAAAEFSGLLAREIAGLGNVEVIDKTLSSADLAQLYDRSDVLVSLHRAEGFGLTLAEAMARGLPAVATDWSGSTDFLSETTGIPIPYRLTPAIDSQDTYNHPDMLWAEANVEAAAEALRRLRDDPALARRLGEGGAAYARAHWTAATYAARVRSLLGRWEGAHG